ncbi:MAG: hypothetical protein GXY48_07225 [Methanomicrobiales archaeon]|nr:hypothetical protein [Methanomicrobiales archaeon]
MFNKVGACLLLVAALVIGVNAIPPLPYEFYGNATVNGSPADAGVVILAKINGVEVGNVTTSEPGTYGGPETFDRRLVVNGAEEQIGEYITFWIEDMQSVEKVKLFAGESQRLDLSFIPGKEGSVDASVVPSQSGTIADVPTEPDTPAPFATQSPLFFAPVLAGLVVFLLSRKE